MIVAIFILIFLLIMAIVVLLEFVGYPKHIKYPGFLFLIGGLLSVHSSFYVSSKIEDMNAKGNGISKGSFEEVMHQIDGSVIIGSIGFAICAAALIAGIITSLKHIYLNRQHLRLEKMTK